MKRCVCVMLCIALFIVSGCEESQPLSGPGAGTGTPGAGTSTPATSTEQAASAKPAAGAEPETTVKKADVGVTGKGQYGTTAEHPMGIVTVPLATYFAAKEMTVFRMQIPQAMNLFKGENGRYPESEQEFMDKIIKANMIQLPQLKPGDTYFYDPANGSLMVKSTRHD